MHDLILSSSLKAIEVLEELLDVRGRGEAKSSKRVDYGEQESASIDHSIT